MIEVKEMELEFRRRMEVERIISMDITAMSEPQQQYY